MKRLFLCLGLLAFALSCQKEEPEGQPIEKEPVIINKEAYIRPTVCFPKSSNVEAHRVNGDTPSIIVSDNDTSIFSFSVKHVPQGIICQIGELRSHERKLSLYTDDTFDWSSQDKDVVIESRHKIYDHRGENPKIYVSTYIYRLVEPEIKIEEARGNFIHEMSRDSLFFDFNGRAFERPSHRTNSWMCRFWSQRHGVDFNIYANCAYKIRHSDWISKELCYSSADNGYTFRVDTNKVHTGSHRVGFIEFIDPAGRVHRRLKIVQERADWFDRQYEVLMEIGNALFTKEELEQRTWGDKDRIQEVVSGHWPPLDHPWDGVDFMMDDGHVVELKLSLGSGVGPIPESIGELWYLSRIEFSSFKNLAGSIPRSLGYLPDIHHISITETSITGTIPESFLEIPCLVDLNLYNNKLSGPVPEWIYTLPNLRYLWLGLNNFDNQPGTGNLLDKQ